MSDPLGEAINEVVLLRCEDHPALLPVLAAARNWHTLTNPTDELINQVNDAMANYDLEVGWTGKGLAATALRAVVDALTVTTDE